MQNLKRQTTLIVWSLCSIYTALTSLFDGVVLSTSHYINFVMLALALALLAQFLSVPDRYLATLLLVIAGLFVKASFTPAIYLLGIGRLEVSWPWVALFVIFVATNRGDLLHWLKYSFSDDDKNNRPT